MDLIEMAIQSRVPVFLPEDIFYGDGISASTKSVLKEINVAYEKYKETHQRWESVLSIHKPSSAAAQTALENIETAFGLFKNTVEKNRSELPDDKLAFYNDLIKSAPFQVQAPAV